MSQIVAMCHVSMIFSSKINGKYKIEPILKISDLIDVKDNSKIKSNKINKLWYLISN